MRKLFPLASLPSILALISLSCVSQINWATDHHHFSDLPLRLAAAVLVGTIAGAFLWKLDEWIRAKSLSAGDLEKTRSPAALSFLPFLIVWLWFFHIPSFLMWGGLFAIVTHGLLRLPIGQKMNPAFDLLPKWLGAFKGFSKWDLLFYAGTAALFTYAGMALVANFPHFGNNAFDLGIQAGAARSSVFRHTFYTDAMNMNFMGDHFSPSLFLVGLAFLIWDNGAVSLVFQNLSLFFCVLIAYALAKEILKSRALAMLMAFLFMINPYFHWMNQYEFHAEVSFGPLILMLLLWTLEKFSFEKNSHWILLILLSLAGLTVKEDLPLVIGCFGFWWFASRPGKRFPGLYLGIVGAVGFLVTAKILIPHFSGGVYTHLPRYSNLGHSPEEILKTILTRPLYVYSQIDWDPVRNFMQTFVYLPYFSPWTILSGFAPIFYNEVSSSGAQHIFFGQYSYPVTPFVFYAAVYGMRYLLPNPADPLRPGIFSPIKKIGDVFSHFRDGIFSLRILILFVALALSVTTAISHWNNTAGFGGYAGKLKQLNAPDPRRESFEKNVLPLLPPDVPVAAVGCLQPQFLKNVYHGYIGTDPGETRATLQKAKALVFVNDHAPWPWGEKDPGYWKFINSLKKEWPVLYEGTYHVVLKKKE